MNWLVVDHSFVLFSRWRHFIFYYLKIFSPLFSGSIPLHPVWLVWINFVCVNTLSIHPPPPDSQPRASGQDLSLGVVTSVTVEPESPDGRDPGVYRVLTHEIDAVDLATTATDIYPRDDSEPGWRNDILNRKKTTTFTDFFQLDVFLSDGEKSNSSPRTLKLLLILFIFLKVFLPFSRSLEMIIHHNPL